VLARREFLDDHGKPANSDDVVACFERLAVEMSPLGGGTASKMSAKACQARESADILLQSCVTFDAVTSRSVVRRP
jgi:hypothetical protein